MFHDLALILGDKMAMWNISETFKSKLPLTRQKQCALLAGSALTLLFGAQAGHAQDTAATAQPTSLNLAGQDSSGPEPAGEIVVTGSLIARPDYKSNSPIVSVSKDVLDNSGQATVEKALSNLPQFSGSFGQSNTSSTGTGLNGGQSYATLRGLGSKRTLILLDGKRLQPSNPDGSVDLNTIPEQLIGNVEVITGGASTAYGSDATGGVVNFRLRRDISGIVIGSQVGTTTYGDGNTYRANISSGGKFAEDRGHFLISLDYTQRNRAKRIERPWYSNRTPQTGNASDPNGAAVFSSTNLPTLAAVNAQLAKYGVGQLTASNGSRTYSGGAMIGFNRDGTVYTINGAPALNLREPESDDAYLVDAGNTIYGPSKQFKFGFTGGDLQTNMKRYSSFGRFDYDLIDNISAYGQFSYVNFNQGAIVNTTLSNNIYLQSVPYNNPFLPADFRAILASRANPTADFQFQKSYNAIGNRFQGYKYNVWQFMVGATGKLSIKDWTWDIYASKSHSEFINTQSGGLSLSRLNKLVYDPNGGTGLCTGGLNLFGNFPISDSCADYIKRDTLNTTKLNQKIVSGQMQGELFPLPAGKVRFALGASYRSNSFGYKPDDALDQPDGTSDIIGFAALRGSSGSVNTKEIFAELLVPVLKDLPLIQELNLDLGYRYSKYNSIGGVSTYKADVDWQVIDAIRLRGGYNRAIRAPSVGELYAPVSSNSTSIGTASATTITGDPCDFRSSFRAGADSAKVHALCVAQGMAESTYTGYIGTAQVFPLTGGNPQLAEETADTFSIGTVLSSPLQEPLLRNIQLSVDYYDIKIKGAVGTLGIAQSLQNCFNVGGANPTFDVNNYYCQLITRASNGALGGNSRQPLLNLGTFQVSGIDIQFDWRSSLENVGLPASAGALSFRTVVSYLDKFNIQQLPGGPTYNYAGTIGQAVETNAGISHPRWKAITSLNYSVGKAGIGVTWRFINKMKYYTDITTSTVTPGVKAYNLFDVNLRYKLPFDVDAHASITNVFNRRPPTYSNTPETYDASSYDVVGRTFLFSMTKAF
jgi:iron complex outermembrane receptor protein